MLSMNTVAKHERTPSPETESMMLDDSPMPGAVDLSSQSSPGSASDHMGSLPSVENFLPGSSDLAKFHKSNAVVPDAATSSSEPKEPNRRQKRLERNRESARLSRRRRKQYLEVLEERVNTMSEDLDRDRRKHILTSIADLQQKRADPVSAATKPELARASPEARVTSTFAWQQIKSCSIPSVNMFVLWLTLQNETFYRGGRAASERLSAARIGERIVSSGTSIASPVQNLWPLFCNEVGLSYDQEEKVRNYQRSLLQDPRSWLDRHTSFAARKVVESVDASMQTLTANLAEREKRTTLSDSQRVSLMQWVNKNKERVKGATKDVPLLSHSGPITQQPRELKKTHHVSANLYMIDERLRKINQRLSKAQPLLPKAVIKKLSIRPRFESLGACDEKMIPHSSSSGSLKRSASEMSIDETLTKPNGNGITPVEAQVAAAALIEQHLGFLRDLLPTPKAAAAAASLYTAPTTTAKSMPSLHERRSSFLPDHLNVVPEEMWPAGSDDILLDMLEGDWAIGEGIDMDTLG